LKILPGSSERSLIVVNVKKDKNAETTDILNELQKASNRIKKFSCKSSSIYPSAHFVDTVYIYLFYHLIIHRKKATYSLACSKIIQGFNGVKAKCGVVQQVFNIKEETHVGCLVRFRTSTRFYEAKASGSTQS